MEILTTTKEWVKFSTKGDFERKEVNLSADLSALRWKTAGGAKAFFQSQGSSLPVNEMRRLTIDKNPAIKTQKLGLDPPRSISPNPFPWSPRVFVFRLIPTPAPGKFNRQFALQIHADSRDLVLYSADEAQLVYFLKGVLWKAVDL